MWGYIGVFTITEEKGDVPSLYVRVYRQGTLYLQIWWRSLIICEGISLPRSSEMRCTTFPHYMWGYIAERERVEKQVKVPSLYVRVYRAAGFGLPVSLGSLIICEGISKIGVREWRSRAFPHYMWGYICLRVPRIHHLFVPSLYVRVYRTHRSPKRKSKSSLIIREGISDKSLTSYDYGLFPHYTWGHICIMKPRAICISVPSLYMRVYRNWQWHPSGIKKYKCSWR